jgi:hypothetical protein
LLQVTMLDLREVGLTSRFLHTQASGFTQRVQE